MPISCPGKSQRSRRWNCVPAGTGPEAITAVSWPRRKTATRNSPDATSAIFGPNHAVDEPAFPEHQSGESVGAARHGTREEDHDPAITGPVHPTGRMVRVSGSPAAGSAAGHPGATGRYPYMPRSHRWTTGAASPPGLTVFRTFRALESMFHHRIQRWRALEEPGEPQIGKDVRRTDGFDPVCVAQDELTSQACWFSEKRMASSCRR